MFVLARAATYSALFTGLLLVFGPIESSETRCMWGRGLLWPVRGFFIDRFSCLGMNRQNGRLAHCRHLLRGNPYTTLSSFVD
jgi:hypothetical protein